MEFKDLKIGDDVYVLENAGTFRKVTSYNIGKVVSIGTPYDDTSNTNPYLASMLKKKIVDITISCEGIQKKLTVGAEKVSITDNNIGLTVSTSKEEMISLIQAQYDDYSNKIVAIERYKEEADKCKRLLEQLKDKPVPIQKILESVVESTSDAIRIS